MTVINHRRRLKKYLSVLEDLKFEIGDITMTGSGHFRIPITCRGNRSVTVIPYSPSDGRAFMNWRSQMRRLAAQQEEQ